MRFYQIEPGTRFYWSGQVSSYCLKCTWLVVYHLQAERFALMLPWSTVGEIQTEHEDILPAQERIRSAHQQGVTLLIMTLALLVALIWFLVVRL